MPDFTALSIARACDRLRSLTLELEIQLSDAESVTWFVDLRDSPLRCEDAFLAKFLAFADRKRLKDSAIGPMGHLRLDGNFQFVSVQGMSSKMHVRHLLKIFSWNESE